MKRPTHAARALSKLFLTLGLSSATLATALNARATVWDNFQSYANNQLIATNATILMGDGSSPWARLGNASSNPFARAGSGPYGDTVCNYGLTWAAGNDWGSMVFHFPVASNLTATPGMSVKVMTTSLPPLTNTFVYAEFQDASANIWRTKTVLAPILSAAYSWQTCVFEFNAWTMDEVQGTGAFSLAAVTDVRVRFANVSGDGSSQTIYLDDFQSYQPPSPSVVWDSFQSYTNNQVLATNATILMGDGSSRWTRFGVAVAGNPVAKTNFGPYLETAGNFALGWSSGNNATLVYNFPASSNLTTSAGLSVKLMPTFLPAATNTLVYAGFVDAAGNSWLTTSGQFLGYSNIWQTFAFKFSAAGMTRAAGSGAFDLTTVTQLRLRFLNTSGDPNGQQIFLDSFGGPLAISAPSVVWDSFQAYTNNEVLASTALSQATNAPSMWGYFGDAAADKLFAKGGLGPYSDLVGDYPIKYSLGTNASLLYFFPALSNLTTTPGFSMKVMVAYLTAVTNTLVYGQFEQTNAGVPTNTIWQSTAGVPLTTASAWQTIAFNFSPTAMVRAQGTNDFDLTAVKDVRVRFLNTGGDSTSQHAYVTDLESYPPKPGALTVPHPLITQITTGPGNAVTLHFTSSDNAAPANFKLDASASLGAGANWQPDNSAVITSIGTGLYQAATTRTAAPTQFYRIRR